jgi:hypothetical protein
MCLPEDDAMVRPLIHYLSEARNVREWRKKAGLQREVGRNWKDISTCAGQTRCARRQEPDPVRAEAWKNAGYKLTDCTIYVKNVISYAYEQIGDSTTAALLRAPKMGLSLFQFLVDKKGWTGIYWNPDVLRPRDGDPDHVDTYITVMRPPGHYHVEWKRTKIDIKVNKDHVVNFEPTPKDEAQPFRKRLKDAGLSNPAPTTDLFRALTQVRFGAVLGSAGWHLALLMSGQAYDVYYFAGPNAKNLYGKEPFKKWASSWCSGVVVVPPGEWEWAKSSSATPTGTAASGTSPGS